jgi:hypothetical protein
MAMELSLRIMGQIIWVTMSVSSAHVHCPSFSLWDSGRGGTRSLPVSQCLSNHTNGASHSVLTQEWHSPVKNRWVRIRYGSSISGNRNDPWVAASSGNTQLPLYYTRTRPWRTKTGFFIFQVSEHSLPHYLLAIGWFIHHYLGKQLCSHSVQCHWGNQTKPAF